MKEKLTIQTFTTKSKCVSTRVMDTVVQIFDIRKILSSKSASSHCCQKQNLRPLQNVMKLQKTAESLENQTQTLYVKFSRSNSGVLRTADRNDDIEKQH